MPIDRVAVRLQSKSLPVARLTALAGRPATRSTEQGMPVSSRQPEGPSHSVSTAVFEQTGEWDALDGVVGALSDLLDQIASARPESGEFDLDLVVAVTAHPLGYMVELGTKQLAALDAAGCGIVLDIYSSANDEETESDG